MATPDTYPAHLDDTTTVSADVLARYNQLVGALYGCLHTDNGFQPFFDAFIRHFNAMQGGIIGLTEQPRRMMFGWTFGYPDGFEEWFINSDLPEKDEALARYSQLPPRQFDSFLGGDPSKNILDMICPQSRVWAEMVCLGDSAGMLAGHAQGCKVVFMANRHRDAGPYTAQDMLQMNLLAPHIEQAVSLHLKLYQSRSTNESLAMALDHVNKPMVVFDVLGTVAQANSAARALLARSNSLSVSADQRLVSSDPRLNRRISDAITTTVMLARKGSPEGRTLFTENRHERIALCITPLLAEDSLQQGALMELFCYDAALQPDLDRIQSLFHCTPAEAAVATDLIHGLGAGEIAEKKGISVHTARQHIKSLLGKNGYRKQTELVSTLVRALA
ncbi:regulatory protein LuxR [Alcanivorax sp. S71-1-4]|uniref:helix-turn-helix transcriptional regulator n=1 Tax=Alcanivorax sp. S71-1-4 TaxID=1177159 RepID=UPI001359F88B|nr:helix-turn-helix transcriptional regulator [Alcanivorax sp. S71-1-4]KAF0809761.1 regulatory protein LuxR [Alcanivorax sp. S71-1-4]